MATVFGLIERDVDRLRRLLTAFEQGELTPIIPPEPEETLPTDHVVVGYLDSAITGIANLNSNPNSGTLSVYSFTSTGQTDTSRNVTVYHFATVNATTDRWIMAKRDATTGRYVIDYMACSTT